MNKKKKDRGKKNEREEKKKCVHPFGLATFTKKKYESLFME